MTFTLTYELNRPQTKNTALISPQSLLTAFSQKEFEMENMGIHTTTGIFKGYNDHEGILVCGYEFGGGDEESCDEVPQNADCPQTKLDCIFSNGELCFGEGWKKWRFQQGVIRWFGLWGHPLTKEKGDFEKTIINTNWCNTQNPDMQGQDYLKKLLDPEQVKNFLYHIQTLRPRLILFFGVKIIDALQKNDALKPFEEIMGKGNPVERLEKPFQGGEGVFGIRVQTFEKCKVVCLPHPSKYPPSDANIALFKDEIGSRIQEIKTLKGI
jgi:hypothetical protein